MIGDALAAFRGKRKPLIICGGGVKYSGANVALQAFAERYGIPFAETQAGKSAVVSSHPLNVGGIGETGCLAANLLAPEADLIIGIGTRYTDFTTASKSLFKHTDVTFLNLNISPCDAVKLDGVQVLGDARVALEALADALGDYRAAGASRCARPRRSCRQRWIVCIRLSIRATGSCPRSMTAWTAPYCVNSSN
jgi:3D-(3,5/4)-trihydroxycyclohexane-1,2-dione acylhydrolase (decyclizing)